MLELFLAVVAASLLGSLHCVGMCGPFVMLAMGSNTKTLHDGSTVGIGRFDRLFRLSAYHGGRLTTYIILGLAVGLLGAAADKSGSWLGMGNTAARVVGLVMVILGAWRLYQFAFHSDQTVAHTSFFTAWTKSLIGLKKRLRFESPAATSYSWGLISTWLPCGWLYVFALAAAASGGPWRAASLMFAFWIGTLPLLSFVAIGLTAFGKNAARYLHPFAAVLLIVFGIYTSTSRAAIDLSSLKNRTIATPTSTDSAGLTKASLDKESLEAITSQPLPCCVERESKAKSNETENNVAQPSESDGDGSHESDQP